MVFFNFLDIVRCLGVILSVRKSNYRFWNNGVILFGLCAMLVFFLFIFIYVSVFECSKFNIEGNGKDLGYKLWF